MNALDMEERSSCWYSEGSDDDATQSFTITFGRQVLPKELQIQFQAGFSAEECNVSVRTLDAEEKWEVIEELEPSDSHELQSFPLTGVKDKAVDAIKIEFQECTDFYGRVMVYRLGILGTEFSDTNADADLDASEAKSK